MFKAIVCVICTKETLIAVSLILDKICNKKGECVRQRNRDRNKKGLIDHIYKTLGMLN